MYKRLALFLLSLIIFVGGCTTLRYNMVFPEAKGFHPAHIGVFPVDVGSYADARGKVDDAIVAALNEEKKIIRAISIGALYGNEELKRDVDLYREKLAKLNYSDPRLCREIADIAQVDALISVTLDYWDYLKEGDSRIVKVGLGIKMINPDTGQPVWEARHFMTEKYLFIKPDLSGVTKKLMKKMAAHMPK